MINKNKVNNYMYIDAFHVGPQKTATTWVYNCCKEHPEIGVPDKDAVHYYTMFYYRGYSWYTKHFSTCKDNKVFLDPSYDYFRSPWAAEYIANDNPNAKIIICLRDPIERAFSHYWHEKKKNRFNFTFDEVFQNFDLYTNWIEPSMYSVHINRFVRYFGWDQIKITWFDELKLNPNKFISEIFEFLGVNSGFTPSILGMQLNVARPPISHFDIVTKQIVKPVYNLLPSNIQFFLKKSYVKIMNNKDKYKIEKIDEVDKDIICQLYLTFQPQLDKLEKLLDVDLNHWRLKYRHLD